MKKIILLFLGCMMSVLTYAQAAYDFMAINSDGIRMYYQISDPVNHYVTLTNGDGGLLNPPSVDPYDTQVRALGIRTFKVPATVENAGITYHVKSIGYQALFANSYTYTYILPEGLETIEESGMWITYTAQNVNFPSTLKTIKPYGLAGMSALATFDLSHTQVTELDNVFGLNFNVEKIIFPETLKTIKGVIGYNSASNFTSITIPAAVETIGYFAGNNLNTIHMKPVTPPTPANGNLKINSTATIYVPADATQPYETAAQWSSYPGQYREQLNIGATGYITYYLENENFKVPTGCTAYIITGVTPSGSVTTPDQAVVKAFTAGKIIPKQTGFVLQGPANSTVTYEANVTGTEESVAGNLLIGTATEQQFSATGKRFYILANGDQGMGFYKQGTRGGMSIKLKAHRAGLRLDESVARAKSIVFDFDTARQEAETTGIQNVPTNGEQQDDVVYDLQGRRVTNPTHGIYIINGKKVIK